MVRALIFALATLLLATPVAAAEPTPGQLKAADELLEVSGAKAAMKPTLDSLVATLKASIKKAMPDADAEVLTIVEDSYAEEFAGKENELLQESIDIYANHFSEEDLRALIAFYKTDAGKRYAAELPLITKAVQDLYAAKTDNIIKRMKDRLAAYAAAKKASPPQ